MMEFIEKYMRRVDCKIGSSYVGDVFSVVEKLLSAGTVVGPCLSVLGRKIMSPRGVVVFEVDDFSSVRELENGVEWIRWVLGLSSTFRSKKPIMVTVGAGKIWKKNIGLYSYVVYRVGKTFLLKDGEAYVGRNFDVRAMVGHDVFGEKIIFGLYPPLTKKLMRKIVEGRKPTVHDVLPGFQGKIENGWILRGKKRVKPAIMWAVDGIFAYIPYDDGLVIVHVPYDYNGVDFWSVSSVDDVPGEIVASRLLDYCVEDAEYYAVDENFLNIVLSFSKNEHKITVDFSGFVEVDGRVLFVGDFDVILALCSFDGIVHAFMML